MKQGSGARDQGSVKPQITPETEGELHCYFCEEIKPFLVAFAVNWKERGHVLICKECLVAGLEVTNEKLGGKSLA